MCHILISLLTCYKLQSKAPRGRCIQKCMSSPKVLIWLTTTRFMVYIRTYAASWTEARPYTFTFSKTSRMERPRGWVKSGGARSHLSILRNKRAFIRLFAPENLFTPSNIPKHPFLHQSTLARPSPRTRIRTSRVWSLYAIHGQVRTGTGQLTFVVITRLWGRTD